MRHVYLLTAMLLCAPVMTSGTAAAGPSQQDVEACLQMIRDMVGVEPSPKVSELCSQGKRDDAMKAAMAGD